MAIRGKKPVIGMFEAGSHSIVECLSSPSHRSCINEALETFNGIVKRMHLTGYEEATGSGQLRYVVARCDAKNRVELTVVWNAADYDAEKASKLMEALVAAKKPHFLSIWMHKHSGNKHDNAVFCRDPDAWIRLHGKKFMRQRPIVAVEPKSQLYFSPQVFRQANATAFEAIVASIRKLVPKESSVLELYGGVGTIGLSLIDLVSSLVCSDENPYNDACFKRALKSLSPELRAKASYVPLDASKMVTVDNFVPCNVLLVDPPRKGLDAAVVAALSWPCRFDPCQFGADKCRQSHLPSSVILPKTLIYVSCGFKALLRDVEALEKNGGWKIAHAEGFVLFPGADHIETLVVMKRK